MLLRKTKRNAAISMLVHLVLMAVLWVITTRTVNKFQSITQVILYFYILGGLLCAGVLMLLLRYAGKTKFRYSFFYQFAGIGNLVYATMGIVLIIFGEPDWTIVWIILSFATGYEIEKDIFTADTQ